MPTQRSRYTPKRGDIIRLNFDPSTGHEQQGTRPALVLTEAVVLCNQVRTVDWQARRAQLIEAAPAELVADVLARVATLIE